MASNISLEDIPTASKETMKTLCDENPIHYYSKLPNAELQMALLNSLDLTSKSTSASKSSSFQCNSEHISSHSNYHLTRLYICCQPFWLRKSRMLNILCYSIFFFLTFRKKSLTISCQLALISFSLQKCRILDLFNPQWRNPSLLQKTPKNFPLNLEKTSCLQRKNWIFVLIVIWKITEWIDLGLRPPGEARTLNPVSGIFVTWCTSYDPWYAWKHKGF